MSDSSSTGLLVTSQTYCTLAEVNARLGLVSTAGDAMLQQIISAVSRWIDTYTGRRFYPAEETRYYTADDAREIWIDDILAVTSLKTDDDADRVYENTWSATDYDLLPDNAQVKDLPFSRIKITPNGSRGFPTKVSKGIELIGSYGYSEDTSNARTVMIKEACLLQSERVWKRKDSPLGVSGMTPLGQQLLKVPGLDPDVKEMLDPFRRLVE